MRLFGTLVLAALLLASHAARSEGFDRSNPVICASVDSLSCAPGEACQAATTEALNIPQFFRIHFAEKVVKAERPDGEERTSEIRSIDELENELILQGTQGGLGWSLTIARATGKMSLSAVGDEVAFVVFGACTRL
ncbi:MAG: hypothetical protein QNJ30_00665 [Kiloniellales bacterium]|nr:hypothetical protein [Kiloniellales bacterium]